MSSDHAKTSAFDLLLMSTAAAESLAAEFRNAADAEELMHLAPSCVKRTGSAQISDIGTRC